MSLSAIGSCDTPSIARPVKVRFKNACAATRITSEPTNGITSLRGKATGPSFKVVEVYSADE